MTPKTDLPISPERLAKMCQIFGRVRIFNELLKCSNGKAVIEEVKKFASNEGLPLEGSLARENKEVWDGTQYVNVPQGDIKEVKEPKVTQKWDRFVSIAKRDDVQQIVIGAVYVPYDKKDDSTVDTHGHACTREEIEKMAYKFMEDLNLKNVDQQHNFKSGYGYVVESYLAKSGDPLFKEGTWVAGVKVTDDVVWKKIEKGEITGFSLAGSARLQEVG